MYIQFTKLIRELKIKYTVVIAITISDRSQSASNKMSYT